MFHIEEEVKEAFLWRQLHRMTREFMNSLVDRAQHAMIGTTNPQSSLNSTIVKFVRVLKFEESLFYAKGHRAHHSCNQLGLVLHPLPY